MKSVKGYFEERMKDPEYRTAYLALEKEHQKRREKLLSRTKEMDLDLRFLEGFLVKNSNLLGWLERWSVLMRLQAMTSVGTAIATIQQGQIPSDASGDQYRIAASTIQTDYHAGLSHIS
jgi:hypothetical protein